MSIIRFYGDWNLLLAINQEWNIWIASEKQINSNISKAPFSPLGNLIKNQNSSRLLNRKT